MDLLEFHDRHMGIYLRGADTHMPQHLLDKTDVCAVIQHQSSHRVAEQVAAATLPDIRFLDVFGDSAAKLVGRHRYAAFIQLLTAQSALIIFPFYKAVYESLTSALLKALLAST